jgi:hypothetical protein
VKGRKKTYRILAQRKSASNDILLLPHLFIYSPSTTDINSHFNNFIQIFIGIYWHLLTNSKNRQRISTFYRKYCRIDPPESLCKIDHYGMRKQNCRRSKEIFQLKNSPLVLLRMKWTMNFTFFFSIKYGESKFNFFYQKWSYCFKKYSSYFSNWSFSFPKQHNQNVRQTSVYL